MTTIKNFETLYNTNIVTGREKQWTIQVLDNGNNTYTVRSIHGIVGGKQVEHDTTISEGKNIGKKNETTPKEQSFLQAERDWVKKKKLGYVSKEIVTSLENVYSEISVNKVVNISSEKIFLKPMLALEFNPSSCSEYPVYVQPKLDGVRCLVYYSGNGTLVFQSRQNTIFDSFEHLVEDIEKLLENMGNPLNFVLDGELYIHGAEFNEITSIVRRSKTKHPNIRNLQYHIYDCFYFGDQNLQKNNMPYSERNKMLTEAFDKHKFKNILLVDTRKATSMEDIEELHSYYTNLSNPYEGVMLRTIDSIYKQQGRSKHLQKYKKFYDDEFVVVGYHEGTGAYSGTAIFDCRSNVDPKKTFGVKMIGSINSRKQIFKDVNEYIHKKLTVKYQEVSPDGIPRFPVGIAFRDYE